MGIFRNENESSYASGRKHFTDVIKNTGDPSALISLAGEEDFNDNSTLVVDESQEAIFMNGGIIERVFPAGTYVLNTNNYPFLSRLANMFSGGVSRYNCKIFFIKKSLVKEFYWGTDSPVQVRDPNLGIQTELSARGAYKVRVENSEIFLTKLAGSNMRSFGEEELIPYFRSQFASYIKSTIAKVIMESNQEILGINARQIELAKMIAPHIAGALNVYGLSLVDFSIESIDIANDENRKNIEAGYAGLIISRSHAQGDKIAAEELGMSYLDKRTLDILQDIANNPGAGGIASAGVGVGAGMATGEWMYKLLSSMNSHPFGGQNNGQSMHQSKPVQEESERERRFVQKTKEQTQQPKVDANREKLRYLKQLLDEGLITQEKYDLAEDAVLQKIISGE